MDKRLTPALFPVLFAAFLSALIPWILGCGTPGSPTPPNESTALPDLRLMVPEGWDGPIFLDGEGLEVSVAWANRGTAMAEDYSIVLEADGDILYRWRKPLLAPGSERVETVGLHELPDPYSLVEGEHRFELVVDPDGTVAEQDETNNSFSTIRRFIASLPDLAPATPLGPAWAAPVTFGGADVVFGRQTGISDRGFFLAHAFSTGGAAPNKLLDQVNEVTVNGALLRDGDFVGAGPGQDGSRSAGPRSAEPRSAEPLEVRAIPMWKVSLLGSPVLVGSNHVTVELDVTNYVVESDEKNNGSASLVNTIASRERTGQDQPDGPTAVVHPVYAVPAGAPDEQWDVNGTIESIVADMQEWLGARSGGWGIRFDEHGGSLDITFIALESDGKALSEAEHPWRPVTRELYDRGMNDPNKIYAVWTTFVPQTAGPLTCGVQTDYQGVKFAYAFFQRVTPGHHRCVNQPTTMVHELFHGFGAVASCAPHYLGQSSEGGRGHVDDEPNDLLYSGDRVGIPLELDKGNDDYFMHHNPGCLDTADSPYLEPVD